MHEISTIDHDPNMQGFSTCSKEYQIAGSHLVGADTSPTSELFLGTTW